MIIPRSIQEFRPQIGGPASIADLRDGPATAAGARCGWAPNYRTMLAEAPESGESVT